MLLRQSSGNRLLDALVWLGVGPTRVGKTGGVGKTELTKANRAWQALSMTKRSNTEFDQVYIGQIIQNWHVDRVRAERRRVLLQAQLAQGNGIELGCIVQSRLRTPRMSALGHELK